MTRQVVGGQLLAAEIQEQPYVLANLLAAGGEQIRAVARVVRQRAPKYVLLAACGRADHAAQYAKYLIEVSLGLPAGLVSPSGMTACGSHRELSDVLVLAISDGCDSPDLVQVLRTARSGGAMTVAITGSSITGSSITGSSITGSSITGSSISSSSESLAQAAHMHIDTMVGPELVPGIKSYSAQLLALWMFLDAYRGGDHSAAAGVPEAAADQLARTDELAGLAARYRFTERLVATGGGYSYPTARQAALKFREVANIAVQAFSGADLLHGPLAMIDQGHPVIAVVPDGLGAAAMRPVLERLSDRGADVAVVGGRQCIQWATVSFDVGCPGIVEELHPVIDIIALQLLALEIARARGVDPDEILAPSKVLPIL